MRRGHPRPLRHGPSAIARSAASVLRIRHLCPETWRHAAEPGAALTRSLAPSLVLPAPSARTFARASAYSSTAAFAAARASTCPEDHAIPQPQWVPPVAAAQPELAVP